MEEVSIKATGGPPTSRIIQDFLEKAGQNALLEELVRTETTFCLAMEKLKRELQGCIQVINILLFEESETNNSFFFIKAMFHLTFFNHCIHSEIHLVTAMKK